MKFLLLIVTYFASFAAFASMNREANYKFTCRSTTWSQAFGPMYYMTSMPQTFGIEAPRSRAFVDVDLARVEDAQGREVKYSMTARFNCVGEDCTMSGYVQAITLDQHGEAIGSSASLLPVFFPSESKAIEMVNGDVLTITCE